MVPAANTAVMEWKMLDFVEKKRGDEKVLEKVISSCGPSAVSTMNRYVNFFLQHQIEAQHWQASHLTRRPTNELVLSLLDDIYYQLICTKKIPKKIGPAMTR